MSDRTYQIVLLGATGFTGGITAHWLATQFPDLKWAIAGRNRSKLEKVRDSLAKVAPHCAELPILDADTNKPDTLQALAESTQVLLTTVGPFIKYGAPVIAACVKAGTDYVDSTGEPEFVATSIREHHEAAIKAGIRIISCCGFDSIPHDMGAWFNVQQLPQKQSIRCEGYVRTRGKVSGGTWNTALEAMGRPQKGVTRGLAPYGPDKRARGIKRSIHRAPDGGWGVPLPTIDPLIVLRSAQLLGYGPDFSYGHYAQVKSTMWMAGGLIGVGTVAGLAKFGPIRRRLQRMIPPGDGPTQEEMDQGWMKVTHIGTEGDKTVRTVMRCDGDPGYKMTARMLASSALCLALDRDELSDQLGVITPAAAMAEALVPRLEHAGFTFEVLD